MLSILAALTLAVPPAAPARPLAMDPSATLRSHPQVLTPDQLKILGKVHWETRPGARTILDPDFVMRPRPDGKDIDPHFVTPVAPAQCARSGDDASGCMRVIQNPS